MADLYLSAGGGFLLAVIWMDLMFDVLALGRGRAELPEEALAQIAGYYRRVTTTASPMNLLISAVMASMVLLLGLEWYGASAAAGAAGRTWIAPLSLALCGVPITLALLRVFPNAIRLGAREDDAAVQSRLAKSIAVDHLACFAAMSAYLLLRLFAAG